MQFTSVLTALGALFAATTSAQQFAGDVIETNLPNVPGAEIAFFKIPGVQDSNSKKSANLTLINYMSYGSNGKRLDGSKVQRAVIIIHGLNRDPGTYESNMLSALAQVKGDPNINKDSVAVMAPYFPNGDDKGKGYPWTDGLKPQRGSTTSALVWKSSQWSAGANNQYPYYSQSTSSYTVLDTLVQYFDDRTLFPNMKQIVVAGHSLGAQTVQRYAAIGNQLGTKSPVTYWVGNPNSYVWLDSNRPLSTTSCPEYDFYRDGYTNFTEYPMTYGQSLVSSGRQAIIANYQSKQIAYARGTQDKGDDSSTCAPFTTGGNRHERFFNFIKAFPVSCSDPASRNCDTVDLVNMGHDAGGMMAAPAGIARLFTDNFYGNGNRSYDFGYPRLENGDDPFPDPSLNSTTSSVNNNTYAGNMTYGGCWSDTGSTRALTILAYDNSANTIEMCTDTCVSKGYKIAGLEFGSQCFCGNEMKYGTQKVIENSCTTACAGNSSEICGNNQRLSIFSNGAPYVLAPASSPETVGKFTYSNCYTDTSPRTLNGKSTSGNFMTLDYCADYCSGYKYFGTEYSSECYCGNTINAPAQIATSSDCSYTCANNTLQYCGAGNRLTLYVNPDAADVPASSTTSSSSTPGATAGTGPSCPASDGTIVTSKGLNFTVECGIDHAGGDLTSQYVGSFQECIDACAANSQCVDVSLSGTACYLKKSLGAAGKSPSIWGAKLMTGGASSSASSTVSSTVSSSTVSSTSQTSSGTSVSSSSSLGSSTVSSSSATSTPSNIACPSSDATTYVGASGRNFVIECGIDHQGGDLSSKYVDNFQACIDACDQTTGCVDVSLSGSACYLKSALGPAVSASYVWGARLAVSSSSSSSASVSSTSSSSVVSSSSSASSTISQSSTSVSSSVSATATAATCPDSDGKTITLASGASFLIECGIDHQGGDLTSKPVKSFAECIAACDTTASCVDVSLSGDMCYMKNAVGAAVKASHISGAKLIPASASSSSSSSSASVSASSSTSGLSSSSTSDVTTSTSSSSSSSSSSSAPAETTTSSSSASSSSQSSVTSSQSSISSSVSSSSTTSSEASLSSSTTSSDSSVSSSSSSTTASSDSSVSSPASQSSPISDAQSQSSSSSTSSESLSSATSQSTTSTSSSSSSESTTSASSTTSSSVSSSSSSAELSSSASSTSSSSSSSSSSSVPVSTSESTSSVSSTSTSSSSSSSSSAPISTSQSTTSASSTSTSSSSSSSSAPVTTSSSATTLVTAVSSSTTASSSSVSSSAASLPSGFSYAGCFIDSSSKRALPVQIGTSTTQTQQQCAMSCQAKGYKYSGTEYANECWCGNEAPTSSAPESQCNMACKGDSTQKCGAGSRLSVVTDDSWKQTFFATQNSGAYNLMGCYTDSTAKRSLPSSVSLAAYGGGANATIANCMSACKARGFAYCGAEYYSECYGSNTAPATTLAGSEPLSAGCNYPCKGNSSESCGGSARIIVYTTNLS